MPKQSEIAACKERFLSHTDEQLIAEKHQWVYHCAEHIAAVQILHERSIAAQTEALELSKRLHQEAMNNSVKLHIRSQIVTWLAVVSSVAGILSPLWLPRITSMMQQKPKLSEAQAPTASPSPQSSPVSQEAIQPLEKRPPKRPQ